MLEQVLAGQELVVESSMVGATRPVLELLDVTWNTDGNSSNNSSIQPTTGAVNVLSSHEQYMQIHLHLHLHLHMHMHCQVCFVCGKWMPTKQHLRRHFERKQGKVLFMSSAADTTF